MPKISKKKRFRGQNRWNVEGTSSCGDDEQHSTTSTGKTTPTRETASMRKLCNQAAGGSDDLDHSFSYRLIELSSLLSAFQPLHQCHAGGELSMSDDVARTYGNSSVFEIECSKCDTKVELQSSGNTSGSWTPQSSMDINRRMVYAASEMGVGRESMSAMCDILNMPPPCNRNAWNNHVNTLYEAHKKVAAENIEKTREKASSLHEPN